MVRFNKLLISKLIALVVIVIFSVTSAAYGIDLSKKIYLRKPLLFNQSVSGDEKERVQEVTEASVSSSGDTKASKKAKKRGRLKKTALAIGAVTFVIPLIGYLGLRYGHDVSIEHLFTAPDPQPIVEFQDEKLMFNFRFFVTPETLETQVNVALRLQMSDQKFWSEIFMNYPNDAPVSSVVTLDVIRKVWKNRQLDDLFNALRVTRPDLVHRYLSEIPYGDMDEFSRYFTTLKPGTRQQIFEIFYRQLRKDFLVLENTETVKSILYPNDYATLSEQAHRMQKLYTKMCQMLNRIHPVEIDELSEGPLAIAELPDGPVAPSPIIAMTRQQSVKNIYRIFDNIVRKYKEQGYTIILPNPENINVSKVALLICWYHEMAGRLGTATFFEDNQSSKLLQWVKQQTDENNPYSHRVTEEELLDKAMQLHINKSNKTVDLFKSIATVGHYYKAMARNPFLVFGGHEERGIEDGTDYIWNKHDPSWLIWALDPEGRYTIDDQGRPVMHWRLVDKEGKDIIPRGQSTGILRFATEDDCYHAWGTILMSLYVSSKSLSDVRKDFQIARHFFNREDNFLIIPFLDKLDRQDFTIKLPIYYKLLQNLKLEKPGWEFQSFGAPTGGSEERIKSVFADVGKMIYERMIPQGLVEFRNISEPISAEVSLRTIEGGRSLKQYLETSTTINQYSEKLKILVSAGQAKYLQQLRDPFNIHFSIDTNITLFEMLLKDNNPQILALVAGHPNTPAGILKQLASYEVPYVREAVAGNPNTPADILDLLALDSDRWVKVKVASNKKTSIASLLNMLNNAYVFGDKDFGLGSFIENEIIKNNKGQIGRHIVKIYNSWSNASPDKELPVEAIEILLRSESLFRQIMKKSPEKIWDHVPIIGNILEDITRLIQAVKEEDRNREPSNNINQKLPLGDFLLERFKGSLTESSSRVFPIYLRHQSQSDFNEIIPVLDIILKKAEKENKKVSLFMERAYLDLDLLDISVVLDIWQKLDQKEPIDEDLSKVLEQYIEDRVSKFRERVINNLKSGGYAALKKDFGEIFDPKFEGFNRKIFSFFQKMLSTSDGFELYFEKPNIELALAQIARVKELFDDKYGLLDYQSNIDKVKEFWLSNANADFKQELLRDKSAAGDLATYTKENPERYVINIRGLNHIRTLERLLQAGDVSKVPYVSSWHLREVGCLRARGMEEAGFDIPEVFSENDIDSIISQEKKLLEHVVKAVSLKDEHLSVFASSFTSDPKLDKSSLYKSISNTVREVLNTFASIGLSKEEAIKVYKISEGLSGIFFNNIVSVYPLSRSLLEQLLYEEFQNLTPRTLSTSDYYTLKTIAYELSQFLISNRLAGEDIDTLDNAIDRAIRAATDDGLIKGEVEKFRKKVDIICKKTISRLSIMLLYPELKSLGYRINNIRNNRIGI